MRVAHVGSWPGENVLGNAWMKARDDYMHRLMGSGIESSTDRQCGTM